MEEEEFRKFVDLMMKFAEKVFFKLDEVDKEISLLKHASSLSSLLRADPGNISRTDGQGPSF